MVRQVRWQHLDVVFHFIAVERRLKSSEACACGAGRGRRTRRRGTAGSLAPRENKLEIGADTEEDGLRLINDARTPCAAHRPLAPDATLPATSDGRDVSLMDAVTSAAHARARLLTCSTHGRADLSNLGQTKSNLNQTTLIELASRHTVCFP